jgi:TatD DNase family protein
MFTDSHCHLDDPALLPRIDEILAEMKRAKVTRALSAGTDPKTFPALSALVSRFDDFYCAVALHPEEVDKPEISVEKLVELSHLPRCVAIGETGLDYHYIAPREPWQIERFRTHIRAAVEANLPLIIHTRDAAEDTLKILREEGAERVGGVMHSCTEDFAFASDAMAMNFYISFSGIVSFKSAAVAHDTARRVPLDRLLIETDSPYLSPVPCRGKYPNEPARVVHVAEAIAKLRGIEVEAVAEATTENFCRLFLK